MSPVKPRELSDRTIILGSMNKENKMSQETLNTWCDILRECPNTKLLIKLDTFDNIEERKTFYMERLKTCENRILIVPKQQNAEYYQLFSHIDILLDPFPYSGTTTTCNALFNSIPVVTLYHKGYHAHNVSASILKHSGLSELVAYSFDEYISIVKELVEHPKKISEYKRTIHGKFREGMMDGARFMKGYEESLIKVLESRRQIGH
jgi:predicted O-linked N-acetylglucosamine transferase (SPINDLY family)